jgi:glycosyltransferase involved in cell wall biosynthesis
MSASNLGVLHINDCDRLGGSGRSAYRIHSTLRRLGVRSRMLVRDKASADPDVAQISKGLVHFLDRTSYHVLERLSLQYLFYSSSFLLPRHEWFKQADILQLFNTHANFFSHTALPLLSRYRPIVWRLSDMWALTGHCTHSFDCERWKTGCGSCPILSDYPELRWDTTALLFKIKNSIYSRSDLNVVAPSKWIANIARQSPLLSRFEIHHIPNGVDLSIFRPEDKAGARKALDLDPRKKVILFSSHLIMNPYKGGPQIREALDRLSADRTIGDVLVLVVGKDAERWENRTGFEVRRLGHISDDTKLAQVYSAADAFVLPTLADTFPNAVLEAMACGTTPITFDVGGCPELVKHLETGYLAQKKDAEDLARGIKLILQNTELNNKLQARALEVVEREHSDDLEGKRFKALYENIIELRRTQPE